MDISGLGTDRMKVMPRAFWMALALPLLAAVLLAGYTQAVAWWQGRAFYAIQPNATRAEVVAALGKPDVIRVCGNNLWWGDGSQYRGPNDGRCVSEERYEHFHTAYGIGYSAEGHVVSKYRRVSE